MRHYQRIGKHRDGPRTGIIRCAARRVTSNTLDYLDILTPFVAAQFLKLWIGAGIRPPRDTKASQLAVLTGMIGA